MSPLLVHFGWIYWGHFKERSPENYLLEESTGTLTQMFERLKSDAPEDSGIRAKNTITSSSPFEEKLTDVLLKLDQKFDAGLIQEDEKAELEDTQIARKHDKTKIPHMTYSGSYTYRQSFININSNK